ncbi:hypothetical protein I6E29_08750 [Arcanobacterium haemolyticum]|nr:hypothetical protein [Arcanobacterium haemolyticum]
MSGVSPSPIWDGGGIDDETYANPIGSSGQGVLRLFLGIGGEGQNVAAVATRRGRSSPTRTRSSMP